MVLMLHINFATDKFHWPQAFQTDPASAWTRTILEYIAIPAVDIFVMISGWFRIRFKLRSLLSYIIQVLYFSLIALILSHVLNSYLFNTHGAEAVANSIPASPSSTLQLIWSNAWAPWFVPTYLLLFLISPILNLFLDRVKPKTLLLSTLIIYSSGWLLSLTTDLDPFHGGYNLLTFIILYLLAASLRAITSPSPRKALHSDRKMEAPGAGVSRLKNSKLLILLFLLSSALNIAAFRLWHKPWIWSYANPMIITQAATTILIFSGIDTNGWPVKLRKAINATAASAFAVYLLHMNPALFGTIFKPFGQYLWSTFSGPLLLPVLLAYILLWYAAAILLDQPRRLLSSIFKSKGR